MNLGPIVSGIIGGILGMLVTGYVASRVGKARVQGELRFGIAMWIVGFACLSMALSPVVLTLFFGHEKEPIAKLAMVVAFGVGAVYCFVDAARVHGRFDDEGIVFTTPWTGVKNERWADLRSVKRNDWGGWYTLTFASGRRIRLSRFLTGHRSALEKAGAVRVT